MRQKYFFTDQIDSKLRQIYAERPDSRRLGVCLGLKQYALLLGWPRNILQKRAGELGLSRIIEPPWTEKEIAVITKYSHRAPAWIRLRLKYYGFNRSTHAIKTKLWRAGLKDSSGFYSAESLAEACGVDTRTVRRWIANGLKAHRRGTQRTLFQGGDVYLIKDSNVRCFVLANPMAVDLRKVDQLWFLDLMFEGKIGQSVHEVLKPKPSVRSKGLSRKREVIAA